LPRAILIVRGGQDLAVPTGNGKRLYAAREPKELYIVAKAGRGGFMQVELQTFEE
jgi:fermentation-respiration switch protein FrsA (DUF1100 family)